MVVLFYNKLPQLGNIFIREMNESDGNSRQNLSQLIIPVKLCMSSKLFFKVSFVYIKLIHIFGYVLMVNSHC